MTLSTVIIKQKKTTYDKLSYCVTIPNLISGGWGLVV